MGRRTGKYQAMNAQRETLVGRLQALAYVGLAVLAVVTCAVVGLALQR